MFMQIKAGMPVHQWVGGYNYTIGVDGCIIRESYPSITVKPGFSQVDCLIAVDNIGEGFRICPSAEVIS